MFAIELQFPAGRYHATPWGRNVNEGEVEWPPSPYRLARALIDVWKRRKPNWAQERMQPLLEALSSVPVFFLPPATAAHTRSFLSSNQRDPSKKQLVFDAFVALDRSVEVLMGFHSDLTSDSIEDLGTLLKELNYFGRSESWVRAKVLKNGNGVEWNCVPLSSGSSKNASETVPVACLLSAEEYHNLPYKHETSTWLKAICMTTGNLLSEGWSDPPALLWVDYMRREDALRPSMGKRPTPIKKDFRCARYSLNSKVLPRVQDTVFFSERIRSHVMGIHKRILDNDPTLVSQKFSGKEVDGTPLNGHRHAFFLPLDEDGDGRLDHLIIYAADPFDNSELAALDRLRSVWQPKRLPDVKLILVSLSAEIPEQSSKQWVSTTPFVTSRHYRKGRGTFEEWLTSEIYRECAFHDLPQPAKVQWIPHTLGTMHPIRWMEFIRNRKHRSQLSGYGCILSFDKPVAGPFALGSCCHFGLGLFAPYFEQ